MRFKVVEYGLPTAALHFFRVLGFHFEGLNHFGSIALGNEMHFHCSAIAHGRGYQFLIFHPVMGTAKIEAEASVLCSHGSTECTTRAYIIFRPGAMPVR